MKESANAKRFCNVQNVFGFNVFNDELSKISTDSKYVISTISPNSYGISTRDSEFMKALKDSDFLVLDGVYFALASIFLKGRNIKKNQGPDLFHHFMSRMNKERGSVFFLGASKQTLRVMRSRARKDYPNVTVGIFSPPFKTEFSREEVLEMIEKVNSFEPQVLFLGMTCPKQEKWAYQNKARVNANIICSVGAVFEWFAGNQKEIHPIWWKLRLAWFKRTIDRPEILKRYPDIGIFFWHLFLSVMRIKKFN